MAQRESFLFALGSLDGGYTAKGQPPALVLWANGIHPFIKWWHLIAVIITVYRD